ncbi:MAG: hypothetical protein OEZ01_03255 [Candidatus Heimdallarchaeota archaeon]|nr:hypothetical protein [Candidatus Heimdallarchaeota archaeon]
MQIHSSYATIKRYEALLELKDFYLDRFKSHPKFNEFISTSYVSIFDEELQEVQKLQNHVTSIQKMITEMQSDFEDAQALEMQMLVDGQEQEFCQDVIGF